MIAPAATAFERIVVAQVSPDASQLATSSLVVVLGFVLVAAIFGFVAFKHVLRSDSDDKSTQTSQHRVAPTSSESASSGETGSQSTPQQTQSVRDSPSRSSDTGDDRPSTTDQVSRPDPGVDTPTLDLEYQDIERVTELGRGGDADVYHGQVTAEGKTFDVAVKEPRISDTLHAQTIDRFLDEAETWATLDEHSHIVDIIDWGSTPLPWIAMEYMDGGHAGDRLGTTGVDEALRITVQVGKAVHYAHRHGVAHLDLKPENVLFRTVSNGQAIPKVGDWGLSKLLLEDSQSVEGLSPAYAAPEQFDSELGPSDDKTDIYQLGALGYALLTGEPPYTGETTEVTHAILTEPPPRPTTVDATLPQAVDDVLTTAMSRERDARQRTAAHFVEELSAILE